MKFTYTSVREPKWSNNEETPIDCIVKFDHIKQEVLFTASSLDPEPHGREIFAKARNGEFGPVAPKTKTNPPVVPILPALPNTIQLPGWPKVGAFLAEANAENAKGTCRGITLVWASAIDEMLGNPDNGFLVR